MRERVVIPNRGVVALDLINSLAAIGLETILLYSPEDASSLAVKLADRSFKFYSAKLEYSYMDREAIIEKALELKAKYINVGLGFLSEDIEFARLCEENGLQLIGVGSEKLKVITNKLELKKIAADLGLETVPGSSPLYSVLDFDLVKNLNFPLIIKPLKGSGGRGIRVADYRKEAQDLIENLLKRDEFQKSGIFVEEFFPCGHLIEIPFIRDYRGNLLLLPEIESSIQRRFQKLFQESPSVNISPELRSELYQQVKKLVNYLDYIGLGYCEFIVVNNVPYFLEINPSFQINTLIAEVQLAANFIKKQFAITNRELLHDVQGVKIVTPRHHTLLASLMAENPYNNFQPSSGIVTDFFHYSSIRNIFKTDLFTGARVSTFYDPFIGKILTFAVKRENALNEMRKFLDNIIIRGISTNLFFLKKLLENEFLRRGEIDIDFLNLKFTMLQKHSEEQLQLAAALLAAQFHIENRRKNYKTELEKLKQPGFFKRLFWKW